MDIKEISALLKQVAKNAETLKEKISSDEYQSKVDELEEFRKNYKRQPRTITFTPEEEYGLSKKEIDNIEEEIKQNYRDSEAIFHKDLDAKAKELGIVDDGYYSVEGYDKIPNEIQSIIYEIIDRYDYSNKLGVLPYIIKYLLWFEKYLDNK